MILKNSTGINTMKKTILTFLLLAMVITLTSCGGGGGGATGGGQPNNPPPTGFTLTLTPLVTSLPANSLAYPIFVGSPFITQLDVRVRFPNGTVAPDGTVVNLTSNNIDVSFISVPDDPDTQEINEFTTAWVTQSLPTVGGIATFFIHAGNTPGTARYTASASSNNVTYAGSVNFNVSQGPDPTVQQLTVQRSRDTLPVNLLGTPFFNGTPFMTETTIQFRDVFGNFTNPASGESDFAFVSVSVNPSTVMYFTTPDYPDTDEINEFENPLSQGPVRMSAGQGNLFLWSRNVPGVATVTLSAIEVGSGRELTYQFQMEVVSGNDPGIPAAVSVNNNGGVLYVNGSSGASSRDLNVTVTSGGASFVDDPQVNNVRLSIVTDGPDSGETLSGVDVNGNAVQGRAINIATTNGITNALVNSGSSPNTITLSATVDRADNNVDNGIQDAITSVTSYIVSDGILHALDLTVPGMDSIVVNLVDENGEEGVSLQDGTYSLVISAVATDRSGNPALPQTLQFGMINSPLVGYPENGAGSFVHSSLDGDPQEGGALFTSQSGRFITSAGGVRLSDTLLVFGEESLGNEDLESAVTVASVNSETSLSIVERFNRNDGTGTINDDLGILPYAIGRAVDGNITATAVIDQLGVATTTLNYPVSNLGQLAAIFVKGEGQLVNGVTRTVTDVELTAFPGVEGFNMQTSILTVSPNVIPGNVSDIPFVVCLLDSARNPLPGRAVGFSYVGANGQGIIDGQSTTGRLDNLTDRNGCTTGLATTIGVLPDEGSGDQFGFNFFSGNITCELEQGEEVCMRVVASEDGVLNANPSSFIGRGTVDIVLTLYDGAGRPIEGASIAGSCEQVDSGSLGIISGPTVTNANGQSFVTVSVSLDSPDGGSDGTCTFAAASGMPEVNVNFSGGDSCQLVNPSPAPPPGACVVEEFMIGGVVNGYNSVDPLVLRNNNTSTAVVLANGPFTFPPQPSGTIYNVTVQTQPAGQTCSVVGGQGVVTTADVTNVLVNCVDNP